MFENTLGFAFRIEVHDQTPVNPSQMPESFDIGQLAWGEDEDILPSRLGDIRNADKLRPVAVSFNAGRECWAGAVEPVVNGILLCWPRLSVLRSAAPIQNI